MNELKNKYPQLLSSAVDAKDTKYKLEGYLYPATYTVGKHDNLKAVVEQMVAKTNMEMKPYFDK
ncbi:endolytic transglycosylase MltG, partial [Staphylococcus epidermidis]